MPEQSLAVLAKACEAFEIELFTAKEAKDIPTLLGYFNLDRFVEILTSPAALSSPDVSIFDVALVLDPVHCTVVSSM